MQRSRTCLLYLAVFSSNHPVWTGLHSILQHLPAVKSRRAISSNRCRFHERTLVEPANRPLSRLSHSMCIPAMRSVKRRTHPSIAVGLRVYGPTLNWSAAPACPARPYLQVLRSMSSPPMRLDDIVSRFRRKRSTAAHNLTFFSVRPSGIGWRGRGRGCGLVRRRGAGGGSSRGWFRSRRFQTGWWCGRCGNGPKGRSGWIRG